MDSNVTQNKRQRREMNKDRKRDQLKGGKRKSMNRCEKGCKSINELVGE